LDGRSKGVSAVRTRLTFAVAFTAVLFSGCSGGPGFNPVQTGSTPSPGVAIHGVIHGGQQAISGAHVYLLAANTAGYGNTSLSLLTAGAGRSEDGNGNYYVTSNSSGAYNITDDYSCLPSSNTQVYLYSIEGDPGLGDGANAAAGLMAGLGACGSLSSNEIIVVNEVTTVATAYALAGFATGATQVSSSSSVLAATGVQNAFGSIKNLVSLSGNALPTTPAGNGIPPAEEIDTLADILAACINSSGPLSTPCKTLFANAMNGSTAPSETATAAINIAHNPGANIATLLGLVTPTAPFQPAFTVANAPNDFTVAIAYSGGGLDGSGFAPEGIAVDGSGDVWVPNFDSNSVSEFKYDGTVLSGTTGFVGAGLDEPTSVAIDIYGNAWVANFLTPTPGLWSISEFNSSGAGVSGPPGYEGSGLNEPYGIAIDNLDHTWVANTGGNNLSEFNSSGSPLSGSKGYAVGSLVGPAGIAADTAGNVWTVDFTGSNGLLVESTSAGAQTPDPSGFSGGGLNAPYGVAIDSAGNVWVTNQNGGNSGDGSLSEFNSSGSPQSGSNGFSGGGIDGPYGLAIDGLGNVWTANNFAWTISEFNSSGTAITGTNGYSSTSLQKPYGIAVDPSGNVWVASNSSSSSSLTEFVGAAAPVVTPLAAGAEYQELATRP
jgi:streptogramin lyase